MEAVQTVYIMNNEEHYHGLSGWIKSETDTQYEVFVARYGHSKMVDKDKVLQKDM